MTGKIEGMQIPNARGVRRLGNPFGRNKRWTKGKRAGRTSVMGSTEETVHRNPSKARCWKGKRTYCLSPRHEKEVRASVREGELGAGNPKTSSGIKTETAACVPSCVCVGGQRSCGVCSVESGP